MRNSRAGDRQAASKTGVGRRQFLGGAAAALTVGLGSHGSGWGIRPARAQSGTGAITVGIDSDPLTLDTRLTSPTQAHVIAMHVTDPLAFRKTNGEVIPYLAESWVRSDPVTWRLNLRKGVKFHNGEPFDAESVKYSLDTVIVPGLFPKTIALKRSWLAAIDRVDIVNSHVVQIRTKYPSRSLLGYLTFFGMQPPRAGRDLGERFGLQPIGTGPYRFVEYVPASHLVVDANRDWWAGRPKNTQVKMRFLPEAATRVAALEAGEVVWINNLPPDRVASIRNNSRLRVAKTTGTRTIYIYLVSNRAPFNKSQARQAVHHAVDKAALVNHILAGQGAVARSMFAPSVLYFKEQPAYRYDGERAKRMLADGGLEPGATLKYIYTTGRFLSDKQIGEAVGNMLSDIGLKLQAESPEWGVFAKHLNSQYAELSVSSYGTLSLDPEFALNFLFNSKTSRTKYANPRVDELLALGDQARDARAARPIYEELQDVLWRESPAVALYHQAEIHGVSSRLSGAEPRPDEYWLFWQMSMA